MRSPDYALVTVTRIVTEDPKEEQWRRLSQFTYETNIKKFLTARGHHAVSGEVLAFIGGSIQQGRAYFSAAETAPLDIGPLLVYYGATNILAGAATMLMGTRPDIRTHGMKLWVPKTDFLADAEISPFDPHHGALHLLGSVFSPGCPLIHSGKWTLEEILASIPDVHAEYMNQYSGTPHTMPMEIVPQKRGVLERTQWINADRFNSLDEILSRIEGLKTAYLAPQHDQGGDYVIFYRKQRGPDIGEYSISGQKHLQVMHVKQNHHLNPSQIMLLFMGLFALGILSRYHPERWTPFVRNDLTGERLVVEKFIDVSMRYLPNLVLNMLTGERLQFAFEMEKPEDPSQFLTEEDVREIINEMRRAGELR